MSQSGLRIVASRALVATACVIPGIAGRAPAQTGEPTLEQRLDRLCEDLDQRREDLHISGLSLAIVKDDQVVLARGFGLRDREQKLPADEHTLYGVGSTTKAFTAMVCAMLADEGKLSFADRPSKYLPWFKFKDPRTDANATLRDMLCHRTGLTRNDVAWVGGGASREELLRSVAETDLSRPFNSTWQYNNCMFLAAGECAAAASGASWDELMAKRIFEPLGMKRSVTAGAVALSDPMLSKRYDWDGAKNDFAPVDWMAVDNMAPAGSICSTVSDMAQWVRFLLNRGVHGEQRLVAEARFDELWNDDDDHVPNYGLGWFIHPGDSEIARTNALKDKKGPRDDGQCWKDAEGRKHLVIEHGGNVAGYAAEVGLLPDYELGVVMLSNTSATQLQAGILPMVWNAIAGPWKERRTVAEGTPVPDDRTKRWLGGFYDERFTWKPARALIRSSNRLTLVLPPEPGRSSATLYTLLWPDADGRWWIREEPDSYVRFDVDESGSLRAIELVESGRPAPSRLLPVKAPLADEAPELTLDELMARRTEATGSDHAATWKSLRLTGTVRFPQAGFKGSYVVTARGTDAVRIDYDAGSFGRSRAISLGDRGSLVAHYGSMPVLTADRAATLLFGNPLVESGDWLAHAEDVELVKSAFNSNFGPLGQACHVVNVKPYGAEPIVYYVGAQDARIVAVEGASAFAGVPNAVPFAKLSDWRDVKGLKLPFHREFEIADIGKVIVQLERAEVDVELPPDFFDLPDPAKPETAGS